MQAVIGGTAEEERLPTGSGQAGLDSKAERQTASLGDTDDHRPCRTNGADDRIGPIFEADLQPEQYAYRADRGAQDAVRAVHQLFSTGNQHVIDADLSGYFDSIQHAELMKSVARRIVDRHVLHLIKQCISALVLLARRTKPLTPTSSNGSADGYARNTRFRARGLIATPISIFTKS